VSRSILISAVLVLVVQGILSWLVQIDYSDNHNIVYINSLDDYCVFHI
jgi:hypothetical protein